MIVLGVLAVVYYLMLLQQPVDFMMDTVSLNRKEQKTEYARVGARETDPHIVFKQGIKGYNTSRYVYTKIQTVHKVQIIRIY